MPHQQAWQHIIDMPIQMDVSAFFQQLMTAGDVELIDANVKRLSNEKYRLVLALLIKTPAWVHYC